MSLVVQVDLLYQTHIILTHYRNLFDIEYYETAQGNNVVYPGAPINVLATVSVEF
jgi:hypothetical protein